MDKCCVCQTDLGNKKKKWYVCVDVVEHAIFTAAVSISERSAEIVQAPGRESVMIAKTDICSRAI